MSFVDVFLELSNTQVFTLAFVGACWPRGLFISMAVCVLLLELGVVPA